MTTPSGVLERFIARDLASIGAEATSSAMQAWVMRDGVVELDEALGVAQFDPVRPFSHTTPMDLASLTKIFTATVAMIAVDRGLVGLHDAAPDWDDITLMHLLNHSSGLPAWDKFYERMPLNPPPEVARQTKQRVREEIVARERREPGLHGVYSDLGYLYLGFWLEDLFGSSLDALVRELITEPLGLGSIRYVSLERGDASLHEAAATEVDERRGGGPVVGTVHDENCHIIGGVAGHAGLFGVARDVGKFAAHLLAVDEGTPGIVTPQTLRLCWSQASRGGDGSHVGGWDTPSGAESSAGRGFSPDHTVGHLGFTGTSVWIERKQRVVSVLLTNRVYPTRENAMIKPLRVAFHEAVLPPSC